MQEELIRRLKDERKDDMKRITILTGAFGSGKHGELGVWIDLAEFLAVEVLLCLEVLHLAGEGGLEERGVEMRDGRGTARAGQQVCPIGFHVIADGGHSTQSGDDYTSRFHS